MATELDMVQSSLAARRITTTLFLAQSLGSASFIASATVTSIAGEQLSGHASWAGVPAMVYLLGAAVASLAWGYLMDIIGRRGGLAAGMACGVVGAGIAGYALNAHYFWFFLTGLLILGMAQAALGLARFAAAEVHPPAQRGRAISNVVIGGTVGAIVGPLLVGPVGDLAAGFGLDELTGAFLAAMVLLALASMAIFAWLKPDPRELGREIARLYPDTDLHRGSVRRVSEIMRQPAAAVAVGTMVIAQMVMVMLMVITALHMKEHHHGLSSVSLVISSHAVGMFAFSIVSGRLTDLWGRAPVILSGSAILVLACLLAPLSPQVVPLAVALFLLGLGWNFCFVGGSSLLSDQLSPAERARTQGFNDLLVGLASAAASLGSGVIFAAAGFAIMGFVGAMVALVPLGLGLWWRFGVARLATAR